jgi:CheY-like chemotaxis protein
LAGSLSSYTDGNSHRGWLAFNEECDGSSRPNEVLGWMIRHEYLQISGPLVALAMSDGGQALIGIVDDQGTSREGIGIALRSAGYRTAAYESVEAFLDGERRSEVRCLVVDLDTPALGNLGLKRYLAQMDASIPIVFLTGRDDLLDMIALNDGAGAVLAKPFTYWALLNTIRSALDFPGRSPRRK